MIVVVTGTNRPASNTARIARITADHLRKAGAEVRLLDLAELPPDLFAPDAYALKPDGFAPFQQAVLDAEGILVVTPEYNGSFPGVLKYFIDMLKFPESLKGIPCCFVGLGAGDWGGLRSVEQLEMIFQYRSAHLFGKRVFIKGVNRQIGEDGRLTDPDLDERLADLGREFVAFCSALARV